MPTTPTSTDDAAALAAAVDLLTAMSHPVRLQVLLVLGREGPCSVGALAERCDAAQSAMSHQLRVLRDARLVRAERAGKHVFYALHDDHVTRVLEDVLAHVAESAR